MDSTLLGVIVGSSLTLIGNFLSHLLTMQKEEKQWERQQEAEEKKRKKEDEKQVRGSIVDIYHNCISRLSLVVASKSESLEISSEEKLQLYKDTLHWLALLALHRSDLYSEGRRTFQDRIKDFAENPDFFADMLLDEVKKMAMFDRMLAPDGPPLKRKDENERRVQVNLDESYRRQMAIEGKELPTHYMFECDITTLTPSQREKLWDMHYPENKGIPPTIYLAVPVFNEKTGQVVLKGPGIWEAKIDPTSASPQEIFCAWEEAFEKALQTAEQAKATRIADESGSKAS